MTNSNAISLIKNRRIVGGLLLFLVVIAALLLLDLRSRGLVWQFFWSQTGEETPMAQLRGMVELGGNLLRTQPDTQPITPIQHTADVPFGINTFLQKEVEEPKLRAMLQMIHEAGFVWLRQEFPWEDLEVDGRGQFTDTRNDYNGDGQPDTIDSWIKYDRIVDLTEEYGLKLMVRLSNPPDWSRANNPETLAGNYAPPDDFQDFVNYASAVANRYKGRITHYQVWNEPNIYPEWGEQFADPAAYTEMLCRTYRALKAIDPKIVVISGAIAPTISLDGYQGYQDLIYLQNMYDNGAGECFDVLAAQGYGLFSGPTDRRMRLTSVNMARHIYYRDLMVANGDAHKPIWLSEVAWNPVLDADLPPEQIADYERYGTTTEEQAARYLPLAYQRAAEEWAWIGNMSYWFFTRPDPSESNQSFFYFRMVEPDYQEDKPTFTPLPVYNAIKDYITQRRENPVLYAGVHQAESWEISRSDNATPVSIENAELGTAITTRSMRFTGYGTAIGVRWQNMPDDVKIWVNGAPVTIDLAAQNWQTSWLIERFIAENHRVEIQSDAEFLVDSVIILDHTRRNLTPLIIPVILIACTFIMSFGVALYRRFQR